MNKAAERISFRRRARSTLLHDLTAQIHDEDAPGSPAPKNVLELIMCFGASKIMIVNSLAVGDIYRDKFAENASSIELSDAEHPDSFVQGDKVQLHFSEKPRPFDRRINLQIEIGPPAVKGAVSNAYQPRIRCSAPILFSETLPDLCWLS